MISNRLHSAVSFSLCAAMLAGCAAETSTTDAVHESASETGKSEQAFILPRDWTFDVISPGFYQAPETGNKIFWVESTTFCWVLDEGEWDAIAIQKNNGNTSYQTAPLSQITSLRSGSVNTHRA